MLAHRRVDTTLAKHLCILAHTIVQIFAHAVQALILITIALTRQFTDGRNGVGIVGGKLRIKQLGLLQQTLSTSQIRQIGVHLARKHGVTRQAILLRNFDFCIPVRALDQAHWQPSAGFLRHGLKVIDHLPATLLIGLNGQPQALPTCQ
jgi:hypothetical protein